MQPFNLSKLTRNFLTKHEFNSGARFYKGFYPSSASVEMDVPIAGKVVTGKCLRAEYYERTNTPKTNLPDAYIELTWGMGKAAEVMILDIWKRMGIYVASNEKFHFKEDSVEISGEIDAVLKDEKGQFFGAEVKSLYGYIAEKEVFGNSSTVGYPKLNNLMQTFLYAYIFRPGNGQRTELPYFKLFYISRGNSETGDFTVRAVKVGDDWYPEVDGQLDKRISLNGMLARWKTLSEYLASNVIPPRDFSIKYSDHQIESYYHAGLVSNSAYEKWKKGKSTTLSNRPGDWNCNYCNFRSLCYASEQPDIPGWDLEKLHLD